MRKAKHRQPTCADHALQFCAAAGTANTVYCSKTLGSALKPACRSELSSAPLCSLQYASAYPFDNRGKSRSSSLLEFDKVGQVPHAWPLRLGRCAKSLEDFAQDVQIAAAHKPRPPHDQLCVHSRNNVSGLSLTKTIPNRTGLRSCRKDGMVSSGKAE